LKWVGGRCIVVLERLDENERDLKLGISFSRP